MPHAHDDPKPSRYWLITSPRTASNMLVKMLYLSEQHVRPANNGGYFFIGVMMKRIAMITKPPNMWTEDERDEMYRLHQEAFDKFQDHIAASEENGQTIFVKEHSLLMNSPEIESQYFHGNGMDSLTKVPQVLAQRGNDNPTRSSLNLTSMPDEFLQTWKPTFLIRHPAMQMESLFRAAIRTTTEGVINRPMVEPMPHERTLKWSRTLYDFYANYYSGMDSQWPIVLDADDLMKQPELVVAYARKAGLDPDKVIFSWDKASNEQVDALSPPEKIMLSSINASTKVDPSKLAGNVDVNKEAARWRHEFGEEMGRKLEAAVREAMPDYEFLHARRMIL